MILGVMDMKNHEISKSQNDDFWVSTSHHMKFHEISCPKTSKNMKCATIQIDVVCVTTQYSIITI